MRIVNRARRLGQRGLALGAAAMVLTSCGWQGIANVPLNMGPGSAKGAKTIYVQIPDTLALNVNSRVRVADVFVGTVRKIELKDWVPTLTLSVDPQVKLPANATAKIGQSSILGTQHVELASPPDPSSQPLRDGATIPLDRSSAFPTVERTLASVATVLRGGGIPNLEVIQNEVNNLLTGNADQIRAFLSKLDVFTAELNRQREDIARAIESTNNLFAYVASRNEHHRPSAGRPAAVGQLPGRGAGPGRRCRRGAGPVQQGDRRDAGGGLARSAHQPRRPAAPVGPARSRCAVPARRAAAHRHRTRTRWTTFRR